MEWHGWVLLLHISVAFHCERVDTAHTTLGEGLCYYQAQVKVFAINTMMVKAPPPPGRDEAVAVEGKEGRGDSPRLPSEGRGLLREGKGGIKHKRSLADVPRRPRLSASWPNPLLAVGPTGWSAGCQHPRGEKEEKGGEERRREGGLICRAPCFVIPYPLSPGG